MPFGEVVCGSPGSGKSTYCHGKQQLFTALNRPISIVNLDPANDNIPYPCAIDLASLIKLEDVMNEFGLGPNGGMLYCMEYLEANYDWLEDRLKELDKEDYVLFDLPGQVELSTNHPSVKNIIRKLTKGGFRVCTGADPYASLTVDPGRLASDCASMRRTLCHGRGQVRVRPHALPSRHAPPRTAPRQRPFQGRPDHAVRRPRYVPALLLRDRDRRNVRVRTRDTTYALSADFNLDFYTEVQDLSHLENLLNQQSPRFAALNVQICSLVEDYGLVGFETLAVEVRALISAVYFL